MSCCPSKQIPMLVRWGDFIWRQRIGVSIPQTTSKLSRAGQLECMTLVRVGPKQTVFNPFPWRHLEPSPSECGRYVTAWFLPSLFFRTFNCICFGFGVLNQFKWTSTHGPTLDFHPSDPSTSNLHFLPWKTPTKAQWIFFIKEKYSFSPWKSLQRRKLQSNP